MSEFKCLKGNTSSSFKILSEGDIYSTELSDEFFILIKKVSDLVFISKKYKGEKL
jgi:hypothetical protein